MTPLQKLLQPALMKIERAEKHINDLHQGISSFLAARPFALACTVDPKTGDATYFIKENLPVPPSFSLTLGDAAHNLRASLDMICFAMVGRRTARPSDVQFPFVRRADSLVDTIKRRQIEFAGTNVVRHIEGLKPYPGGHEWLYDLHELDIRDKHQLVLTVGSTATMSALEFSAFVPHFFDKLTEKTTRNTMIFWPVGTSFKVLGGTKNRASRRASGQLIRAESKAKLQPPFQMVFGPEEPFAKDVVVQRLINLAAGVRNIVEEIGAAYIGDPQNV